MNKKELSRWSKENKMIVNKYEGMDLYIFATDLYVALLDIKEYIEKDTRWFDSDYVNTYGELCDCEGIKGDRLEVLVNPSNILNIINKALGSDKE